MSRRSDRSSRALTRLGSEYGGWWVPARSLRPGAVAYCVGAGEDITFDVALLDLGLRVVTIDPTPRAIAHVERQALEQESFTFLPIGVWDQRGRLKFYEPQDPAHVSHSATNLQDTDGFFMADVETVATVARRLDHPAIEILKLDIEGAELRVLPQMLREGPWPHVLCVEFHGPVPRRIALTLKARGYRLRKIEGPNRTFVRLRAWPNRASGRAKGRAPS